MATVDVNIGLIEGGKLVEIEAFQPRNPWGLPKMPPYRLKITAENDFTLELDMPNRELADMLEMVWRAHEYGCDEGDEEQTLADLRRVMADREARR